MWRWPAVAISAIKTAVVQILVIAHSVRKLDDGIRRRASAYWCEVLALCLFATCVCKGNAADTILVGTVVISLAPFFSVDLGGSRMSGCPVSECTAVSTDPDGAVEGDCATNVMGSCSGLCGAVAGSANRWPFPAG